MQIVKKIKEYRENCKEEYLIDRIKYRAKVGRELLESENINKNINQERRKK